jgi:lipid-A-disaccharide synthase
VKHHFPVTFVGHPLIDAIHNQTVISRQDFIRENKLEDKPIIALLPGSRKQEISKMLSVMLSVVGDFEDYQFVIAGAPSQDYAFYLPFLKSKNVHFISNKTYELLSHATAALVTSGTATLETALFKVPEVVCYKGSWASYQIAKRIITLKYISLVNLIMDQEVVTELIQEKCNTKNIRIELQKILDPTHRNELIANYSSLEEKLGGVGASKKTAQLIVRSLSK